MPSTIAPMTSDAISRSIPTADDHLWRAIVADLAFWTVAGAVAGMLSAPIGHLIDVRPLYLAIGAGGLAVVSVGLLLGLNRTRPVSRALVWGFAVGNLALAPLGWLTALFGWLPLSSF